MAKPDYKPDSRPAKKHKPSALIPFLAGAFCGVFGAFLLYLYLGQETMPSANKINNPEPVAAKPAASEKPRVFDKTQFEFYTILEESDEIVMPEKTPPTIHQQSTFESVTTYLLQLGAFKKSSDAQSLRAELLLKNFFNTYIETTTHNNQIWHRVRVGPYRNYQTAAQAKRKLKQYAPIITKTKG